MWPNPQELRIWSHLLKKSLIENFIFCAVICLQKCIEKIINGPYPWCQSIIQSSLDIHIEKKYLDFYLLKSVENKETGISKEWKIFASPLGSR